MTLPTTLDGLSGLRAARWIRESTRGQYDSFGPDAQRDQQDRAIERYELVDTGIVWQVAHSGRTIAKTEQFTDMLNRAGRDFDVLVVGYVSRFTRDLRTAVNSRHDLHAAGAVLLFCDEKVLSSDEESWDHWARETVEAESYSRRLGRNIRSGYEAKFRRHADQGGNAPVGFTRTGPAHTLEIDPIAIARVVAMFERYAEGVFSYEDLSTQFSIHADLVRTILDNPIYNGWARRYRRSRHEQRQATPWRSNPPVSDDLWDRVQDVRSRRHHGAPQPKRGVDPLGGLLYCKCGRRVRSNGTNGKPPRRQRLHPGHCAEWGEFRTTWGDTHDAPVYAQLAGIRLDAETLDRVGRALQQGTETPTSIDSARLDRQKRELALAHAAGRIGDGEYLSRMTQLRSAPPAEPSDAVDPSVAIALLRDVAAAARAKGVSDEARAQLLRAVYERITVTRDGFVSVELTAHAYRHGLDIALPQTVGARPAGVEPGSAVRRAVRIPILGARRRAPAARKTA